MAELLTCCPGVAGTRIRLGARTMDRLPMRPMARANPSASICGQERGEGICSWVVRGRNVGEDKELFGMRLRVVGGRDDWRRRNFTGIRYVQKSNSVTEAPTIPGSSNPGVEVSEKKEEEEDAHVDGEKRRKQGGGKSSKKETEAEEELEQGYKMSKICDRLIEVFMIEKTSPAQWRNLLAFSIEWVRIRPHFFKRCKNNAKAETDPKRKRQLLKLARQVKEVDENMIRHDKLLAEIEKNDFGIDVLVAKKRKEFTGEFFDHLQTLCDASPKLSRQDEIAAIAGKCLSVIEAYDTAIEDSEAIGEAQLTFDGILNSPSLEAATNKINQLARSKELDSTLLVLITKAWAAAKDSTTMKQEVKDIMFHLYGAAKTSMLKLVPDEIRIIKYLLSIPDPRERFAAMTKSFAPGDDLEDKDDNTLHTKPDKLRHWIKLILDAYHTNKKTTMIKEAQKLMNPQAITRLEMLLEFVNDQFV